MRTITINNSFNDVDITYNTTLWGLAEIDLAVVVANLPAMRMLFSHWYHAAVNKKEGRACRPSRFVIQTDEQENWKVDRESQISGVAVLAHSMESNSVGVEPRENTSRSGSNGRLGPFALLGKHLPTRMKKGVTDSTLFRGSLFYDTTIDTALAEESKISEESTKHPYFLNQEEENAISQSEKC